MGLAQRAAIDDYEDYFLNIKTKEKYRQVLGSLTGPSGLYLAACLVLAQDYDKDPKFGGEQHLRILVEYENPNPTDVLKRCTEYRHMYQAKRWYGDPDSPVLKPFLNDTGFYLLRVPSCGQPHNLQYYHSLIREVISADRKLLHFGSKSILPTRLAALDPNKVRTGRAEEFPLICCLGYALAALKTYFYDPLEQARADAANAELSIHFGD